MLFVVVLVIFSPLLFSRIKIVFFLGKRNLSLLLVVVVVLVPAEAEQVLEGLDGGCCSEVEVERKREKRERGRKRVSVGDEREPTFDLETETEKKKTEPLFLSFHSLYPLLLPSLMIGSSYLSIIFLNALAFPPSLSAARFGSLLILA